MDIDYIELDDAKAVAVIEATRSNSADLGYGLFSFLSRGYAQAAALILLAEKLGTKAYALSYGPDMGYVELLPLERELIPKLDEIDCLRQDYAAAARQKHGNRSRAQGEAVSLLYADERGRSLMEYLRPMRLHLTLAEYREWLERLRQS